MPRPRFHTLPMERQRALLDTAGEHFALDGYQGASLNRILESAGLSKGVAYYYFDDKADLFATVVERTWADTQAAVSFDLDALDRDSFWPAMESLYLAQIQSFDARPWQSRLIRAVPDALATDAGERLAARLAPLATALESLRARASTLGLIRQDLPEPMVLAMLRGLDGALDAWWADNPKATYDTVLVRRAFHAMRVVVEGEAGGAP